MAIRQTRIFVCVDDPDDWAETVIGRVIKPAVEKYNSSLRWFWFSRYCNADQDRGNCDFSAIPDSHKQPQSPYHRSLRFRFNIVDDQRVSFEQHATRLIEKWGYAISDFRDYPAWREDSSGDRFLGIENRKPGRAQNRSRLVLAFYHGVSQLVVDALVGPDGAGRYRIESNDHGNNPLGSTFESLHHLFCNISAVPLQVTVHIDANSASVKSPFARGDFNLPKLPVTVDVRVQF